jgi:LAO/AO transport system kinase
VIGRHKLDRRTLSAQLTQAANARVAEALQLSEEITSSSRRIGITGPPGVGKSSLIARLAGMRLQQPGDLAIVVVDPTSPVSGGAVLGDRIRMESLASDPRVFIRSLASRSNLDGLAENLPDILQIFENSGFVELIIETVGVGQVEYAVRNLVDTLVLVLMPGVGDQVQAMKGGILEKADIYAINKADLPGAPQLAAALNMVLKQRKTHPGGWTPLILLTSASNDASIEGLDTAINRHQAWMQANAGAESVQTRRRGYHIGSLIARRVSEVLRELPPEALRRPLTDLYDTVVQELGRRARVLPSDQKTP